MRSRKANQAIYSGIVALALTSTAIAGSYEQHDLTDQSLGFVNLHLSQEGAVCGSPLFDPAPKAKSTISASGYPADYQDHAVDYCKELVIVDPAVLGRLEHVQFSEVFQALGAGEQDARQQYESWIANWQQPAGDYPGFLAACQEDVDVDVVCPRLAIHQRLQAQGPASFKLIAVVNRLDLFRPEARLVYQLIEGSSPAPFTAIFEFDLSASTRGPMAQAWHALGSDAHDAATYVEQLQALIDGFAIPTHFLRVRTNERLEPTQSWQLRQFNRADSAAGLAATDLTRSILDAYQNSGSNPRKQFDDFLVSHSREIAKNDPHFYASDDWTVHEGYKANISSTMDGSSRLWPDSTAEWFTVAFNTCSGCHHNDNEGDAQHIALSKLTAPAALSAFLTKSIPMDFPLPECSGETPLPGCEMADKKWNELRNRADLLLADALKKPKPLGDFLESLFGRSKAPSVHRVH